MKSADVVEWSCQGNGKRAADLSSCCGVRPYVRILPGPLTVPVKHLQTGRGLQYLDVPIWVQSIVPNHSKIAPGT